MKLFTLLVSLMLTKFRVAVLKDQIMVMTMRMEITILYSGTTLVIGMRYSRNLEAARLVNA